MNTSAQHHPGCYRPDPREHPEVHCLRHTHERACTDRACGGCTPCEVDEHGNIARHCQGCTGRHASHLQGTDQVCPRCVGRVRGALVDVVDCMALMPEEAEHTGIESEAFALAGPVAHLAEWHRRTTLAPAGRDLPALLDRDETDPYFVLATWERELRIELGHDEYVTCSATLTGAVYYLDQQLTDLAQHPYRWALVPALGADVARVRAHLEAVLHDSRGPERGAPCPACATTAGGDGDDPDDPEVARAPRLVLKRDDEDVSGASDAWVCPRCQATWREADYRLRVASDALAHAAALTADQMHAQWRIKPSTLRKWAERGVVARRGRDGSGRLLYDVAQAVAQRDSAVTA